MLPNLTFNGQKKPYLFIKEKKRPYAAPRNREITSVSTRPGGYLTATEVDVLNIDVTFHVTADSRAILQQQAEEIVGWLYTKDPAPLIFDDEPYRTYYAVVEGGLEAEEIVRFGTFTVSFICPDPFKYGPERTMTFDSSGVRAIINQGTEDAIPIFTAKVKSKITNLDIVTWDSYMRVGSPTAVSVTPKDPRTVILTDELASTAGWSAASTVDNGHVVGTMKSDGNGFIAESWGAVMTPARWQGPSMVRGLSTPLQDFVMEADIEQLNGVDEAGMLEIYCRDASGAIIAKIGMSDEWRDSKMNQGKFQLGNVGNRVDFAKQAANAWNWDDYKGMLRIVRNGQNFTAYFAKIDAKGVHHTRANITYFDSAKKYQNPITTIQIAIRKWPDSKVPQTTMRVTKLVVSRINTVAVAEPIYIAEAGDVIEINHKTGDITVNGEPRLWIKDFGSSFFRLKPGENIVSVNPMSSVDMTVKWQERYG